MTRALVTGAHGFIGRHLCASLEQDGIDVIKVGRHTPLPGIDVDIIYHLADNAGNRPYVTQHSGDIFLHNLTATTDILYYWVLRNPYARLVTFGSLWAYPSNVERASEDVFWAGPMLDGIECYGVNKRLLYSGLKAIKQQYGLLGTMLTLGNVYGPGDKETKIIPSLINRMRASPNRLEVWGNDSRDFIFVEDQVRAIRLMSEYDGDMLNISTGIQYNVLDVAHILRDLMNYQGEIVHLPSSNPADTRQLDISRCKSLYLWPDDKMHSLHDGLTKTIEGYTWQNGH